MNSTMNTKEMQLHCPLDRVSQRVLEKAISSMGMSARSYATTLKVARTIADLEGAPSIEEPHILEALSYRSNVLP